MDKQLKNDIIDIFKGEGLEVVEDTAEIACKGAFALLRVLAPKLPFGLSIFFLPALDMLEKEVLELVDEIDED
jgi:hypothetical protein